MLLGFVFTLYDKHKQSFFSQANVDFAAYTFTTRKAFSPISIRQEAAAVGHR